MQHQAITTQPGLTADSGAQRPKTEELNEQQLETVVGGAGYLEIGNIKGESQTSSTRRSQFASKSSTKFRP